MWSCTELRSVLAFKCRRRNVATTRWSQSERNYYENDHEEVLHLKITDWADSTVLRRMHKTATTDPTVDCLLLWPSLPSSSSTLHPVSLRRTLLPANKCYLQKNNRNVCCLAVLAHFLREIRSMRSCSILITNHVVVMVGCSQFPEYSLEINSFPRRSFSPLSRVRPV